MHPKQVIMGVLGGVLALMVVCCGGPMLLFGPGRQKEPELHSQSDFNQPSNANSAANHGDLLPQEQEIPSELAIPEPQLGALSTNNEPIQSSQSELESELAMGDSAPFDTVPIAGFHITAETENREWGSADGKHKVTARLLAMKQGYIQLNQDSKGKSSVELKKLRLVDYNYVCNVLKTNRNSSVVVGSVSDDGLAPDELVFTDIYGTDFTANLRNVVIPPLSTPARGDNYSLYLEKIRRKTGWIEYSSEDEQGRMLATLFVDGRNVNLDLVAEGIGWYVQENGATDHRFANAEFLAKSGKRGLWANESPKSP